MKRTPATKVNRVLHDTNVVPGTGTPFPVPATREERFLPGHSSYGHDIVAPRRDVFDDAEWEDAAPAPWEEDEEEEEEDDLDALFADWDDAFEGEVRAWLARHPAADDDVPEHFTDAQGRACYGTATFRRLVD